MFTNTNKTFFSARQITMKMKRLRRDRVNGLKEGNQFKLTSAVPERLFKMELKMSPLIFVKSMKFSKSRDSLVNKNMEKFKIKDFN